ncbi:GNAT family N-acetyltransferase [Evansella halocellulosilytica]|uniref:GNAT family N-acetyltransferase n=1 Tax=Evansella halocellulosilytica TaxID=2011013 RepID=UPI0015C9039C|nr:GNAT family N-acetyltransferase [Evansella halocellulosilytica]
MTRTCYLFGANPSLEGPSKEFAEKAGGRNAHIALLILRRPDWEQYMPMYTDPWKEAGVTNISVIMPREDGKLGVDESLKVLHDATGIFIGGGDTEKYYSYYCDRQVRNAIKEKYVKGIPVAGCSAGALLLPNTCILSPNDTATGERKILEGIGLLEDIGISVHFTEWNDRKNIEVSMKEAGLTKGYGIDEQACIRFDNERYVKSFGESVHLIQMGRKKIDLTFKEVINEEEKATICERILHQLPEWFGIEEALNNYILEVKHRRMIVVFHWEEPVGFLTIQEETKTTNEIHLIAVHPDYHNQGIGKMLVAEMEYLSIIEGKSFLAVKTLSEKHPDPHYKNTRLFYETVGFVGVQQLTELWGPENPCLVMIKNITS